MSNELHDFLSALLIETGFDPKELSPAAASMLVAFAERAEIAPGASREQTAASLRAYFKAHPIDPKLIASFNRKVRRELLSTHDPKAVAAFASRWLVANEPGEDGVIGRGPRRKPK